MFLPSFCQFSDNLLSENDSPANKKRVAYYEGWINSNEKTKFGNQTSKKIQLEVGKYYYLEALYKEGSGDDQLQIAWKMPGSTTRDIISSEFLSAWIGDSQVGWSEKLYLYNLYSTRNTPGLGNCQRTTIYFVARRFSNASQ